MRLLRNAVTAILLLLLCVFPIYAQQNNQIFPTGPVFVLNNLVWGTTGTSVGFNNNFFFTPNSTGNLCISVQIINNNPTSSHAFTLILSQTPSPVIPIIIGNFSSFGTSGNSTALISASGVYNLNAQTNGGSAFVAIQLSNGTTQAGSPDTATIVIVQSAGPCVQQNPNSVAPFAFPGANLNSEATGAANTPVAFAVTVLTSTPQRALLFSVNAHCSAGTAQLTVKDGATQIWSSALTEVSTTTFRFQWNPGLMGSIGNTMTVNLSTCGAANAGTLDIQSSAIAIAQ